MMLNFVSDDLKVGHSDFFYAVVYLQRNAVEKFAIWIIEHDTDENNA